jgi:IS605 OrfB family transposase
VVERIGDAEARKVDDRLHKIARQLVSDAEGRNAVIVVGDLGGIRKDNDKGRYVNDKTHKMPFARLLNYIEYKAHGAGIDVRLVDEYDTSKTCNRCACEGVRETQGQFECPECGLDDNADKNGALNIGKRALGKFSKPLSERGLYWHSPKRRSSSNVTTNLRTSRYSWIQPPVGEPHGFRRGRMSGAGAVRRVPVHADLSQSSPYRLPAVGRSSWDTVREIRISHRPQSTAWQPRPRPPRTLRRGGR